MGRWTQQDPKAGNLDNPDKLNRYLYAMDDPVNMVDPSGKMPCFLAVIFALLIIFGFVIGVIAPPLDLLLFIAFVIGGLTGGGYAFDAVIQACDPGAVPQI